MALHQDILVAVYQLQLNQDKHTGVFPWKTTTKNHGCEQKNQKALVLLYLPPGLLPNAINSSFYCC